MKHDPRTFRYRADEKGVEWLEVPFHSLDCVYGKLSHQARQHPEIPELDEIARDVNWMILPTWQRFENQTRRLNWAEMMPHIQKGMTKAEVLDAVYKFPNVAYVYEPEDIALFYDILIRRIELGKNKG